ncbi:MAG TPA: 4'-phosphopantetheinyl transferase superfamily protein [Verrucomicrobiae bacterium]|jgi:KDO2-lipid IV(A) lauroyltransferase|nr:4'-phosphopantetheinyl transferase superfamily protein [Verrucomicrobiae bacterium]
MNAQLQLPEAPPGRRCGLDTVEVARVARFLQDKTGEELTKLFTASELEIAGTGAGRVASLAARFAAKEACCKLFPRETALGMITAADFAVERTAHGAPCVKPSANAQAVLDRHRVAEIRVSLTHTETSASAIAWVDRRPIEVPWYGRWLYHLLPYRRGVVLGNLRRVFGDVLSEAEILRLAQAYYAHYVRFTWEFIRWPFMSQTRRKDWIRVENVDVPLRAHQKGKGILLLTGHFGNFEVSTVAGISQYPQYRGLLHFVRRPIKTRLINDFVTRRFQRAGFGVLPKRGSLDQILDLLANGGIIVYVFDQHAGKGDGITVEFLGHPAGTFKSVALLALTTGAPVVPAYSWREPDGRHVLRFEEELPLIEHENVGEAIRLNTRAYNAALERMLLRHPEQWIWMHRRWKVVPPSAH